jgi:hypothetical protein
MRSNQWVDKRFELFHLSWVVEDKIPELTPINPIRSGNAWKGGRDESSGRSGIDFVNRLIRIMNRDAQRPENLRGRRFSHADGTSQTDNPH